MYWNTIHTYVKWHDTEKILSAYTFEAIKFKNIKIELMLEKR